MFYLDKVINPTDDDCVTKLEDMDNIVFTDTLGDDAVDKLDVYSIIGSKKSGKKTIFAALIPEDGSIVIKGISLSKNDNILQRFRRDNDMKYIQTSSWLLYVDHSQLFGINTMKWNEALKYKVQLSSYSGKDHIVCEEGLSANRIDPKRKFSTIYFPEEYDLGYNITLSNRSSMNRRKTGRVITLSEKPQANEKHFKLNKREELISQMDGVFEKVIPAEEFVQGFREIQRHLDEIVPDPVRRRSLLSSICTIVLADPSYRLQDCRPLKNSYEGSINVDIDFFTVKAVFQMDKHDFVDETDFLRYWYEQLTKDVIIDESLLNNATRFNINMLKKQSSPELGKGLEPQTKHEKAKYLGVATSCCMAEVFRLSYQVSGVSNPDPHGLIELSFEVINFIVSSKDTYFDSANNRDKVSKYMVTYFLPGSIDDSNDVLEVPGGILFPLLTLLLVLYRNADKQVTIAMETYGGKSKGIKTKYVPGETDVDDLTRLLLKREENKAAKVFHRFLNQLENHLEFNQVRPAIVKLGIGGENADETLHEAWVCQPVQLEKVESMRSEPISTLFLSEEHISSEKSVSRSYNSDCDSYDDFIRNDFSLSDCDDNDDIEEERNLISEGRYKNHLLMRIKHCYEMYPILGSMLGSTMLPVTATMSKTTKSLMKFCESNESIQSNMKIIRLQSYSPTFRHVNGHSSKNRGGANKVADSLLNYRSGFGKTIKGDKFLNMNGSKKGLDEWITLAENILDDSKKHGIARLEVTVRLSGKNVSECIDEETNKAVDVLLKLFKKCTRSYDANVMADLALVHLLAIEGRGNAVITAMNSPESITVLNEYCAVWAALTCEATKFFTGRGSLFSALSYAPRISIATGRALLSYNWYFSNRVLSQTLRDGFDRLLIDKWYNALPSNKDKSISFDKTMSMLDNLYKLENDVGFAVDGYIMQSKSKARSNRNITYACISCWRIFGTMKAHDCNLNSFVNAMKDPAFDRHLSLEIRKLDDYQKIAFLHILTSEKNIFLTGVAGAGKSFTTNILYKHFAYTLGYGKVRLVATTNTAAALIDAETIHRFLGIGVNHQCIHMVSTGEGIESYYRDLFRRYPWKSEEFLELEVLGVDEVSMLSVKLLQFMDKVFKYVRTSDKIFGGVRMILIGDPLQLPPTPDTVLGRDGRKQKALREPMFYTSPLFFDGNFDVAYLKGKPHRQEDEELVKLLNLIRVGNEDKGRVIEMINNRALFGTSVNRKVYHMAVQVCQDLHHDSLNQFFQSECFLYFNRAHKDHFGIDTVQDRGTDNIKDIGNTFIATTENKQNISYTNQRNYDSEVRGMKSITVQKYNCHAVNMNDQAVEYKNIQKYVEEEYENIFPTRLKLYEGQIVRLTVNVSETLRLNKEVTIVQIVQDDVNGQEVMVRYQRSSGVVTENIKIVAISREVQSICLNTGKHELSKVSVSALPLRDAFASTGWKWQGSEVAMAFNLLFDNSRCMKGDENKGLLYTIFSRCKVMAQLAILHSIRKGEISGNVDWSAVLFDSYHSSIGVISSVDYRFIDGFMIRNGDNEKISTRKYCPWLHE